ncbi:TIGR04282 family arsenosugar biosynthesis glycosyltransferase [Nocardia stercoris]|uniref:DUF2064 domain-containing protein n=1 Tax=Nocardia stercoris TaxID=2483361 RepID=A0A3M2LBN8_9NOCA|nr:DUF2064 domain-containing protein [Nocardia stercoris]RMI34962.1 DUF2064 domain-containing protein [Nocardia stercoris]
MSATVLVLAKAPIPGFAKTRLTPPLTPVEAAAVAAAALLDTLDAVLRARVAHRMVAWTGDLDRAHDAAELAALLARFDVVAQRGATFGERLANAHADAARAGHPVLQIGMDTPQADPDLLTSAAAAVAAGDDVHLGPARDGGWWALGLPSPQAARLLVDVPMSTDRTGELTREALRRCHYRVRDLPELRDVDYLDDAFAVAGQCTGRFARLVGELRDRTAAIR